VGDVAGPAGLDVRALTAWLDATHPGLRDGDLRATVIAGGRSNLTYALDDGTHRWVLRRPPLGHVLATAHDMAREHRVISALAGGPVPVPATVALCTDHDVIGAPFFVMERAPGRVLRTGDDLRQVPGDERAPLARRLVDTLAALHGIDPEAVGLADLGRPDGFAARQVRRWGTQLAASRSRDVPGIDDLHAALGAAVPTSQAVAVLHGDFRLDNLLVTDDHRVGAVLDWEMATLGDPLTDLGLALVYWGRPGAGELLGPVAATPGTIEGYLGGDDLARRYADATGADLADLPWYVALGCFKLAVVLEGIHYRFTRGQTVGADFDTIGAAVSPLVAAGRAALAG
jgi:aminoglycoside phosphotransferase (APT) family kinase protein